MEWTPSGPALEMHRPKFRWLAGEYGPTPKNTALLKDKCHMFDHRSCNLSRRYYCYLEFSNLRKPTIRHWLIYLRCEWFLNILMYSTVDSRQAISSLTRSALTRVGATHWVLAFTRHFSNSQFNQSTKVIELHNVTLAVINWLSRLHNHTTKAILWLPSWQRKLINISSWQQP